MAYKIKISKSGFNVLTETNPNNLRFSSDYNTLKYYLNGTVNVDVYFDTEGYYSFTEEITHGLGYKPFFKCYAFWFGYSPVGIFTLADNHNVFLTASVDDNKMYFKAEGYNSVVYTPGNSILTLYLDLYNTWNEEYCAILDPGNQCFDLVVAWTDLLEVPHYPDNPSPFPVDNAYQIFTEFGAFQDDYFDLITYSSGLVPQLGDIVVWENAYNGAGGHTGVATGSGNSSTFQAFEQNDPIGSYCHVKSYSYSHVLGWLRPTGIGGTVTDPDVIDYTATFKYKIFKNDTGL